MKNTILLFVFLFSLFVTKAQNLLNTDTWTVGSGSVSGFNQKGITSENSREWGDNSLDNNVILWKASPDSGGGASGGWDTDYHSIDHTKAYRFTIWLKKTNSTDGTTYLGCLSPGNILQLNETVNGNPYFWHGDLPQLNKWYLVVGYVHASTYNSLENYGGIYDGITGEKITSITDFKFKTTATQVAHRSFQYYDSNTSDRLYLWDPRLEQVNGDEPTIEELVGLNELDQNLLDTSSWTIGSGSVAGFSQNGTTAENSREYGINHVGEEVILWKASPDSGWYASGGWNTSSVSINHSKTYRFSVWLKKTNSSDGKSYFGCRSIDNILELNSSVSQLNGGVNNNPYFWIGDLPRLDRWYLLVGFVHKSDFTSIRNQGKIYDGVTGQVVTNITDFKFKNTATTVKHRAYLYYDSNTLDRQYFYAPRIDEINGNEPTLLELMMINEDSKIIFAYDDSGNQSQRFYCADPDSCVPIASSKQMIEEYTSVDKEEELPEIEDKEEAVRYNYEEYLQIYPNPTENLVTIHIQSELLSQTKTIRLFDAHSRLIENLSFKKTNKIEIDLTGKPLGIYFIHIHLDSGESITKKILKI